MTSVVASLIEALIYFHITMDNLICDSNSVLFYESYNNILPTQQVNFIVYELCLCGYAESKTDIAEA